MKRKILILTLIILSSFSGCADSASGSVPEIPISSTETDISEIVETDVPVDNMFQEPENQLFTDAEKADIDSTVLNAAENVWECYEDITLDGDSVFSSNIGNFTDEKLINTVTALGKLGFVVRSDITDTENPEIMENFYRNYQSGKSDMITVFEVYRDGFISTITFLFRSSAIQVYYAGISAGKDKEPVINGKSVQDIEYIRLTEKGYFFYAYKNILEHQSLCEYFRVRPLPAKCRELTDKYLKNLSFQKYRLMITDWDAGNISDVLGPGLFDDFYFIRYGYLFAESNDGIPGEIFESIMTTYLPVTVRQLRLSYEYDESKNVYHGDTAFSKPYSPFAEVVDFRNNSDGTVTLFADGVWPDYRSDYAFTSEIAVQPLGENEFRILSNKIEKKELDLPCPFFAE